MRFSVLPLRTPTLPPATHTNCWRLGRAVIDPASPWEEEQERLWAWLADDPPEIILLTHHHEDHIGGAAALRARCGARILAHREARLPFEVDGWLGEGDEVDTGAGRLRCVETPGHSAGHLCFVLDGEGDEGAGREVAVGDMLAGVGTILIAPPEGDLGQYLASLARLAGIGGRFLPAHGGAMEDGAAAARGYIAHREARTAQVRAALAAGRRGAAEIAGWIYAGIPGVDMGIAAIQVEAHLRYMERGA